MTHSHPRYPLPNYQIPSPLEIEPMTAPSTVDELLDYWPGNIPFKGSLVSDDGSCMCAQGQVLHFLDGATTDDLSYYGQAAADKRVAELLGISRAHAVLLRVVNDGRPGAPSVVIRDPAQVLGDQADRILAFWWHLDRMTPAAWAAARAAVGAAVGEAAWAAAREAAREAAWAAAWAAARATNEIQGAAVMREKGQPFFLLSLFGFATPDEIPVIEDQS